VDDCDPLQRVGAPVLPFRTVRLLLPPGAKGARIETRAPRGSTTVPGFWEVEYGRVPLTTPAIEPVESMSPAIADAPDAAIYASDAPYPTAAVDLVSVQRLAGYAIAFLRVYPVRYLPARGELQFTPELEVLLTIEPDQAEPTTPSTASTPTPIESRMGPHEIAVLTPKRNATPIPALDPALAPDPCGRARGRELDLRRLSLRACPFTEA